MDPPNDTDISGPAGSWLRKLLRYCKANRLREGRGYRLKRTLHGTFLEIFTGGGVGGTVTGRTPKTISEVRNSVIKTVDGLYVAKPYELRYSINAETIDGTLWTYAYDTTYPATDTRHQARVASSGQYSEQQVITPRYLIGGIIWVDTPAATLITSGDLNDSPGVTPAMVTLQVASGPHAWAQKYGQ